MHARCVPRVTTSASKSARTPEEGNDTSVRYLTKTVSQECSSMWRIPIDFIVFAHLHRNLSIKIGEETGEHESETRSCKRTEADEEFAMVGKFAENLQIVSTNSLSILVDISLVFVS